MHEIRLEGFAARANKLAASALSLKRQSGVSPPFSLAFLTDQKRAPQPQLIARALPPGAAMILRDYEHKDRAALAVELKSICAERGLFLLIGADSDLAEEIGADGHHAPAWYNGPQAAFPHAINTTSCHDAAALSGATAAGFDVIFLSPAFPTASHPGKAALGANNFRKLAAMSPAPVLALGGVTEENAHQLAGANVAGLAAIGAFLN